MNCTSSSYSLKSGQLLWKSQLHEKLGSPKMHLAHSCWFCLAILCSLHLFRSRILMETFSLVLLGLVFNTKSWDVFSTRKVFKTFGILTLGSLSLKANNFFDFSTFSESLYSLFSWKIVKLVGAIITHNCAIFVLLN